MSPLSVRPTQFEEDLVKEATGIVDAARERGIELRIMGATAVRIHCPKFAPLHKALEREITDIDIMGYGKQKNDTLELLEDLGYSCDRRMRMVAAILQRYLFENPTNKRHIDVFFDRLEFCHTIDFNGRLDLDYPTISLTDLFLEKMQIVEINEKDIKDVIVLLREHEIGKPSKESIEDGYISSLLSRDWGFYYTVTTNLSKVTTFLPKYEALMAEGRSDVVAKIDCLSRTIEDAEKSLKWKIRAKTGPRKIWYRKVEEIGV